MGKQKRKCINFRGRYLCVVISRHVKNLGCAVLFVINFRKKANFITYSFFPVSVVKLYTVFKHSPRSLCSYWGKIVPTWGTAEYYQEKMWLRPFWGRYMAIFHFISLQTQSPISLIFKIYFCRISLSHEL